MKSKRKNKQRVSKKRIIYYIKYREGVKFFSSENDFTIEIWKPEVIEKFVRKCKIHNYILKELL